MHSLPPGEAAVPARGNTRVRVVQLTQGRLDLDLAAQAADPSIDPGQTQSGLTQAGGVKGFEQVPDGIAVHTVAAIRNREPQPAIGRVLGLEPEPTAVGGHRLESVLANLAQHLFAD